MTLKRKNHASDRGSGHAIVRARAKIKPQAYISRTPTGHYIAKDEDGHPLAYAQRYADCHKECQSLGYVPNRFHDGDAPKTA